MTIKELKVGDKVKFKHFYGEKFVGEKIGHILEINRLINHYRIIESNTGDIFFIYQDLIVSKIEILPPDICFQIGSRKRLDGEIEIPIKRDTEELAAEIPPAKEISVNDLRIGDVVEYWLKKNLLSQFATISGIFIDGSFYCVCRVSGYGFKVDKKDIICKLIKEEKKIPVKQPAAPAKSFKFDFKPYETYYERNHYGKSFIMMTGYFQGQDVSVPIPIENASESGLLNTTFTVEIKEKI